MTTLMDLIGLLPTCLAVIAAVATTAAALLVLHAVDLRVGGWLAGAGWMAVAASSAWCAAVGVLGDVRVPVPLALLAVALAVLAWMNLDALMCRASCVHARRYALWPDSGGNVGCGGQARPLRARRAR